MSKMSTKVSDRGFIFGEIASVSPSNPPLSVSESSSAETPCLWVGVQEPQILRFTPNYERMPYTGEGLWETLDLNSVVPKSPNGSVHAFGRAHLDRAAVRALSKSLNYWLRHGRLPTEKSK